MATSTANNMKRETAKRELEKVKTNNLDIIGQYIDAKTKIQVRCKKCGHEWGMLSNNIKKGVGCSLCANNVKKTTERFKKEVEEINPSISIIGKYVNSKELITVKCNRCGHEWEAYPSVLLKGSRCKRCNSNNTSFMEQFLFLAFERLLGKENVQSRNTKEIGKELDIFIPSIKLALEPGSWFYHKDKVSLDINKYELCKRKGIRLIIIYDSCDKTFNDKEYIKTFDFELKSEKNNKTLKEIIMFLCDEYKLDTSIIDDDFWKEITKEAISNTLQLSTEEYAKLLMKINDTIQIIGRYEGMTSNIACRCLKCGHEWSPQANHLLEGHGCTNCVGYKRRTHEEFVNDLYRVNSDIEVRGLFTTTTSRIAVKCLKCGHEWSPFASDLLVGKGCAKCAGVLKKSHEDFVKEVSKITNSIEICSNYKGANEEINVKCLKCGHTWTTTPSSLLAKKGCSKCAGVLKKSHEDFVKELEIKNPKVVVIDEYVNAHTLIKVRGTKCGHEWEALPNNLLKGTGCKRCYLENRKNHLR